MINNRNNHCFTPARPYAGPNAASRAVREAPAARVAKRRAKTEDELFDAPERLSEGQRANWNHELAHTPPGLLERLDRGVLVAWVVAEDLRRQAAAQARVGLLVRLGMKETAAMAGKDYSVAARDAPVS
jgi:hypothetical protein